MDTLQLPPPLKEAGFKKIERAAINDLSEQVRRNRIVPGVGIKLTQTVNGTVIEVDPNFRTDGESGASRWL